jgi:hypothetical protein
LINSCYQSTAEEAVPKIMMKEEMLPETIKLLEYQGMDS